MDDFGAGLGAEGTFPGGNKGGLGNDLAGGVDGTDVFEDIVGDGVKGSVGHKIINA